MPTFREGTPFVIPIRIFVNQITKGGRWMPAFGDKAPARRALTTLIR